MDFNTHTDRELWDAYDRATGVVRRALEDHEAGKLDMDTVLECQKLYGDIGLELKRRGLK